MKTLNHIIFYNLVLTRSLTPWRIQMWVPNWKQWKSKESGHAPWLITLWRGRKACWSSRLGLGRIDKFQLLTQTCTKPTQGGYCIVGALLVLGRTTSNSDSQDSPQPELGWSHHLPPYSILCASPQGPHLNGILSQDSQVGVPKFSSFGLSQTWGPITFHVELGLRPGPKQSCSPRQELSNDMWHTICMQENLVDSWLLVVGSQIINLILDLSFGHNLCFKCPNESCDPI